MRDYFSALLLRHLGDRSDIGLDVDERVATDPITAGDTPSPSRTVQAVPIARTIVASVRQNHGPAANRMALPVVPAATASQSYAATRFETAASPKQFARPAPSFSTDRGMATPIAVGRPPYDEPPQAQNAMAERDRASGSDDVARPVARGDALGTPVANISTETAPGSVDPRRSAVQTGDARSTRADSEHDNEQSHDGSAHRRGPDTAPADPVVIEAVTPVVEDGIVHASAHDALTPAMFRRRELPTVAAREPTFDARVDARADDTVRRHAPRVVGAQSPVAPPPAPFSAAPERPSVTVTIERLELQPATVARPAASTRPVTLDAIAARRQRDGVS